jgi:hypothetical protein
MRRAIALQLGPESWNLREDPLELLHDVWVEHRSRFGGGSWASQFWERGHDSRLDDVYDPDGPAGCPGLPDQPPRENGSARTSDRV